MGKVAFVFPGQGAQYAGMGKELVDHSPAASAVFQHLDALRPGTSQQCFEGPEALLQQTEVTQPCLFAAEVAAAAALEEAGIRADMTAGFSLGEWSAVFYAHIVDLSTSFDLVCSRGRLMQHAAEQVETSMAAVVRLDNETVEGLCAQFEGVYPVNYNCPGQVTVAARRDQMAPFSAAVKAAGGRALPLKVSGGFHSPFMAVAAGQFRQCLESVFFSDPVIPLYSDVTGLPYAGSFHTLLADQICSPVRWEAIVRHMITQGADTFIEVGPGKVLSGLIEKTDKTVRTLQVSDKETLEQTIQEVKAC